MRDMEIQKISADKLNPAKYNPRKDLQPGDPDYEKLLRSAAPKSTVSLSIWTMCGRKC